MTVRNNTNTMQQAYVPRMSLDVPLGDMGHFNAALPGIAIQP